MVLRVVPVDSMLSCNNNVTSASYNTKSNSYRILMSYSTHDALHWNVALMSPELRIQLPFEQKATHFLFTVLHAQATMPFALCLYNII